VGCTCIDQWRGFRAPSAKRVLNCHSKLTCGAKQKASLLTGFLWAQAGGMT
jgi:hypothetical protein